jgi:hypothetical protein
MQFLNTKTAEAPSKTAVNSFFRKGGSAAQPFFKPTIQRQINHHPPTETTGAPHEPGRVESGEIPGHAHTTELPPPARTGFGIGEQFQVSREFDKNTELGPVTFQSIAVTGQVSGEIADPGSSGTMGRNGEPAPSRDQVRIGSTSEGRRTTGGHGDPNSASRGIQAEYQHSFQQFTDRWGDEITPQFTTGGQLSTSGGELGFGFNLQGQVFSAGLNFTLVGGEWSEGNVYWMRLSIPFRVRKSWSTRISGAEAQVQFTGTITLNFQPNYRRLRTWIGERFAQMATAEVATAAGFIAGGAATIAAAVYTISLGDEIAVKARHAQDNLRDYCRSYQNVMRGREPIASEGGRRGAADALRRINVSRVPQQALAEAAQRRDLFQEAFNHVWPRMRQQIIDDYWREHYVERFLTGREGMGSGGFSTFIRTVDAAADYVLNHE